MNQSESAAVCGKEPRSNLLGRSRRYKFNLAHLISPFYTTTHHNDIQLLRRTIPSSPVSKMRFFLVTLLFALFCASAWAVKPSQKAVIITYPEDTPPHEVDNAIKALEEAGGIVTHEYSMLPAISNGSH